MCKSLQRLQALCISKHACRPKHVFALLRVLAAAIGSAYIETAIETWVHGPSDQSPLYLHTYSAQTKLESADPKLEPNLQVLAVLHSVDLICHLWQQYVNMALLPLASTSVTVRREMVVFNNQTVSRIEGAANQVMQRLTDST